MKERVKLVIGSIVVAALAYWAYLYDAAIMGFVGSLRIGYLDYWFMSIAFASNIFIIFFFLTSLFLWKEHKRRWVLPLWLSGAFSVVISYLLKNSIGRLRPFQNGVIDAIQVGIYFMKDNYMTWNTSFPSFQAMFVFSALPVLDKEFPKLKYVWLVFALLVAFSRVYFGLHYLSDVLAGALIGYLIGAIMVYIEEKKGYGKKVNKALGFGR